MAKKYLIACLVACILISPISSYAASLQDSVGSDANDVAIGKDYTQGESTGYGSLETNNPDYTESRGVDVFATKCSHVGLYIPDTLIGSSDGTGSYKVGVKGDISSKQTLKVVPDATFSLTDGVQTVQATVTQTKTSWNYAELGADYVYTTGTINFKIPAGSFSGVFEFDIYLESL